MNKPELNIGNRFVAGLVDYIIIFGFSFFLSYLIGEPNNEGGYSLSGLPALIPVIFWLIMTVGLESGFGGTIGNSLVGLKAIPLSGEKRKLTFVESFKRHLLDPIDMFFFGLVAIITIKSTEKNQRIGDLWAKTTVVLIKSMKKENHHFTKLTTNN